MSKIIDSAMNNLPFLKQSVYQCFSNSLIENVIAARMSELGLVNLRAYLDYAVGVKSEEEAIYKKLINSYSQFFRNSLTFAFLEHSIFPNLMLAKENQPLKEVRVWSAACASGQEPYSIAMLLLEMHQNRYPLASFRIVATDIQSCQLENARKGSYLYDDVSNLSLQRIQNWFVVDHHNYTIKDQVKEVVSFEQFDLLASPGNSPSSSIFGCFDVVFCANLLFYYNPASICQILERIKRNLNPDGVLVVGEAEKEIVEKHGFKELFPGSCVCRQINKTQLSGNIIID
jgi:chemotaxis methyl-accepting protein methylase